MSHLNRLLLIGLCTATLAGCGGGTAEPAATPDASATASETASASDTAGPANLPEAARPAPSSAAFARPLVVAEAAFVRVAPPPRPDNGQVEVHPGIRPREPGAPGQPSHAVGAPSARSPLSGR